MPCISGVADSNSTSYFRASDSLGRHWPLTFLLLPLSLSLSLFSLPPFVPSSSLSLSLCPPHPLSVSLLSMPLSPWSLPLSPLSLSLSLCLSISLSLCVSLSLPLSLSLSLCFCLSLSLSYSLSLSLSLSFCLHCSQQQSFPHFSQRRQNTNQQRAGRGIRAWDPWLATPAPRGLFSVGRHSVRGGTPRLTRYLGCAGGILHS